MPNDVSPLFYEKGDASYIYFLAQNRASGGCMIHPSPVKYTANQTTQDLDTIVGNRIREQLAGKSREDLVKMLVRMTLRKAHGEPEEFLFSTAIEPDKLKAFLENLPSDVWQQMRRQHNLLCLE